MKNEMINYLNGLLKAMNKATGSTKEDLWKEFLNCRRMVCNITGLQIEINEDATKVIIL